MHWHLVWLRPTSVAALSAATAYQLACAFQPLDFLQRHLLVMDDAYYYFQVAWNMAHHGRATFDGTHLTTGVQLLWVQVLGMLAALFDDRVAFLRAVLVLCAILNAAAGAALWALARRFDSGRAGDFAVALWSIFMAGLWPTLIGMEYSLHVLVLIATVGLWFVILDRRAAPGNFAVLAFGALLTLNYWARLDAALYSVLLAATVAARLWRTAKTRAAAVRQVALLAFVPLVGAVVYTAVCQTMGKTWLPISGLVKAHYATEHFAAHGWVTAAAGRMYWWILIQCRPLLDLIDPSIMAGHRPLLRPLPLALIVAVGTASSWGAQQIAAQRRSNPDRLRAAKLLGLLWVFGAMHVASVVATIGHFSHVTQHYYGWLTVTWCLWLSLVLSVATTGPRYRLRAAIVGGIVAVLLAVNSREAFSRFEEQGTASLAERRDRVAVWMDVHLPPGVQVGAWNAGQLGYFSRHPVVNLDGLANDGEYLAQLRRGEPVHGYLCRNGIEYLVDVNVPDLTMPYRASWDSERYFRRTLPWSGLDVLYRDTTGQPTIFVVRLRREEPGWAGCPRATAEE